MKKKIIGYSLGLLSAALGYVAKQIVESTKKDKYDAKIKELEEELDELKED